MCGACWIFPDRIARSHSLKRCMSEILAAPSFEPPSWHDRNLPITSLRRATTVPTHSLRGTDSQLFGNLYCTCARRPSIDNIASAESEMKLQHLHRIGKLAKKFHAKVWLDGPAICSRISESKYRDVADKAAAQIDSDMCRVDKCIQQCGNVLDA